MILPLCNQECVVSYKGARHIGVASKSGVNAQGQYRITVWSRSWGYDLDFKASDVELVVVTLHSGTYAPQVEFCKRYSAAEQSAMAAAESAGRTAAPIVSTPAPAPAPVAAKRIMRRVSN